MFTFKWSNPNHSRLDWSFFGILRCEGNLWTTLFRSLGEDSSIKPLTIGQGAVGDDVIEICGLCFALLHHGAGLAIPTVDVFLFFSVPTKNHIQKHFKANGAVAVVVVVVVAAAAVDKNMQSNLAWTWLTLPTLLSHLVLASGFSVMAVFKSTVTWTLFYRLGISKNIISGFSTASAIQCIKNI